MMSNLNNKTNQTKSSVWAIIQKDYDLHETLGEGSFGEVLKATEKKSGKMFAIKLVRNTFNDQYSARKIVREVGILRKLTKMKGNLFTTKLYDVVIPKIDPI